MITYDRINIVITFSFTTVRIILRVILQNWIYVTLIAIQCVACLILELITLCLGIGRGF